MTDVPEQEISLRDMLDKAGLTQMYIAKKANCTPAAVSTHCGRQVKIQAN